MLTRLIKPIFLAALPHILWGAVAVGLGGLALGSSKRGATASEQAQAYQRSLAASEASYEALAESYESLAIRHSEANKQTIKLIEELNASNERYQSAKAALNAKLSSPSNNGWANTAVPDGLFNSKAVP